VTRATGPVVVDGRLDEATWDAAARATGFTEIQPGDAVRPPVCTEVLMTYDDAHLYVAFLAHDEPGAAVRTSLRDRDEMFQDDRVGLILDTFGDATQAYMIYANPIGVQGDLLMSASSGEDSSFDLVFEAAGRRVEGDGYRVEMAIPFSSLRFPDADEQTWRATFMRTRPRDTRQQFSWASVNRDDPCQMCQFGTLTGIEGIAPGTNLDLLPALTGSQATRLRDAGDPSQGLDAARVELEPSATLRYGLTPSLALEATLNPDFSQVESDAAQIGVNTTFALFFPERRPFFQEGADVFETYLDLVYTRSINSPLAATKLTGRAGRWNVAYLGALDRASPVLVPVREASAVVEAGRSLSNIVRARRSFGANSYAGATVTDRRLAEGGGGTVVSADLRWQFATRYRLEAQLAASHVQEARAEAFTGQLGGLADDTLRSSGRTLAFDGERLRGTGVVLDLDRRARHWSFDLGYRHLSPTFRTPNGFVTRNDVHRVRTWQGYTFFGDGFVERVRPQVYGELEYRFDGTPQQAFAQAMLWMRVKSQTSAFVSLNMSRERFAGRVFERLHRWYAEANTFFSDPVQFGASLGGGRSIYRATPELGRRRNASLWANLKPVERLMIQPRVTYAFMEDPVTDANFFAGWVARVRTNVQLSIPWSVRLVTQYDAFAERVRVEPLLAYKRNPFTVFYVGATPGFARFEADPNDAAASAYDGWAATGWQVFFKLQYLVRV
jgi:hypothetical protein